MRHTIDTIVVVAMKNGQNPYTVYIYGSYRKIKLGCCFLDHSVLYSGIKEAMLGRFSKKLGHSLSVTFTCRLVSIITEDLASHSRDGSNRYIENIVYLDIMGIVSYLRLC